MFSGLTQLKLLNNQSCIVSIQSLGKTSEGIDLLPLLKYPDATSTWFNRRSEGTSQAFYQFVATSVSRFPEASGHLGARFSRWLIWIYRYLDLFRFSQWYFHSIPNHQCYSRKPRDVIQRELCGLKPPDLDQNQRVLRQEQKQTYVFRVSRLISSFPAYLVTTDIMSKISRRRIIALTDFRFTEVC